MAARRGAILLAASGGLRERFFDGQEIGMKRSEVER
jgi:hypothetical protein